ncbi:hypothetical protein V2A60_006463 [Cordyceps javanica]|uniref:Alanine and arginine rich protein n=1 Tax=Cordyceps javanica TaxID=43265 RepID=A0A545V7X6_9HYPO|nr:alanine and arginine rich protein [Cordyceps javanica]TQW09011.1 alanine and arginine rich protein [Cordyceps javanica]
MAFVEITVPPSAPMPRGYKLLRKGYAFMTGLCRRKTMDAGRTLYVVRSGSKTLGLRAPRHIVNEVYEEERQTRVTRRAAVAARDETMRHAFEAAIREHFPDMPDADAEKVLQRALKKRSGRVGRTSKLDMQDKVRLAVAAHVRHSHTNYDGLVRGETSREDARKLVYSSVRQVLAKWEGRCEQSIATTAGRDSPARRRNPRATTRARSEEPSPSFREDEVVREATPSSLHDPILISSDSEEESVDILTISSDEEQCRAV